MDAVTRVLKTVNHEEPDRVPAFESAFVNNTIQAHYGHPVKGDMGALFKMLMKVPFKMKLYNKYWGNQKLITQMYLEAYKFQKTVKLDLVLSAVSLFPRKIVKGGFIDEYGRHMRFEIYEKDGSAILGYVRGTFDSFDDYESFERPDPHDPKRLVHFLAGLEAQKELNNEVFSIPATAALWEVAWEGFGIETFSKILARKKQAEKVFNDNGKFTLEMVKILVDNGAKMVLLWDDFGFKNGLFSAPRVFRKHVFPWYKQICDYAHKNGSKIVLHSDGDLTQIFEDIINSGVDVLNPIESTTANPEYDIFKLNEKYGDKITFCGNISPVMLATGEISEIEEYSKRLIREVAPGGGYIFSSGHSINPAVTVDRFEAVLRIREKYGYYPINVPK
ncbi:MAG: hypothetical protein GY870_22495 [archaeon]|nr:hypothetical protein [archaeon]